MEKTTFESSVHRDAVKEKGIVVLLRAKRLDRGV